MIERQKKLYLCRPNGRVLTQLNGVQTNSVSYAVHAKDYNDITFNVDRYIIVDGKPVETNGYEDLHVGMNVLLEGCDMFQIQEPTIINDGVKEYKVVKANSIEYEFQEKNWVGLKVNTGSEDSLEYLIDGNVNDFGIVAPENYITIYKGNNSGRTDHSLLHYIIAKVPGWSINDSDIDGTLWDKKITIDEDNINLYALLTSVIGPKAECIFLFDTINKKIKAISKDSLNESYFDTNIFISMRNLAQHIEVRTNEDSVYTVFNVAGDNNIDVASANFNDKYVYDLSYFMSEPWMSNATAAKITAWMNWRDNNRTTFINYSKQLEEKTAKIKEITYLCPNDGDDWQQWDQMDRENLTRAREMYVSYLNAMRRDVDPDPAFDPVSGDYIPRQNYETQYENLLLQENKGYYTYIEIRDYVIPNIDIAYSNKGKVDDEKDDYVKDYETNWDLFGISLLEGKEEGYLQQLEQLDKYKKSWNQLTPSEKAQHLNEGDYNIKHNLYVEINETLLPGLRARLASLRSQVSTLETQANTINTNILSLVNRAKISDPYWGLTQDELDLFTQLCKYTDYTNKNILFTSSDDTISQIDIQKTLYDDAVSKLSEVSQPQYTFSVNADNFFDIKEFASWKEKFELLRFMRVGIRDDYSVKLRLVGYTTNPCEIDSLLSVDFSNFITSRSGRSDLTELLDTENNSPSKNSISIGNASSKTAEEYATKLFQMMSRSGLLSGSYGNTASTTSTNSSFTGVSMANLIKMYATSGYITDAVISEAKVTDYLDAVKINAATVEAGTLIADRILLKNDASAILYQLNNLGSLTSEETKTLDGYVLTDRTILADKIVANSITANELTVDNIVGTHGWINLHDGTFWYGGQNVNDSLSWDGTALSLQGRLVARNGQIGGFVITSSLDSTDVSNVGKTTANNGHVFTNSLYAHSSNNTYEYETGLTTGSVTSGNLLPTEKAFYIKRISKNAAWSTATDIFYVLHDGSMKATSADITGTINAISGSIGDWEIANGLHRQVGLTGNTYDIYVGSDSDTPSPTSRAIWIKNDEHGTVTYPISIKYDGTMDVSKINASGGTIGGWNISSSQLYKTITSGNNQLQSIVSPSNVTVSSISSNKGYAVGMSPTGLAVSEGTINGSTFSATKNISLMGGNISATGDIYGGSYVGSGGGIGAVTYVSAGTTISAVGSISGSEFYENGTSLTNKYAAKSHGNHVPTTQTADNAKFLRNDNTWQTVTPANIGAATSGHNHDSVYLKLSGGSLTGNVSSTGTFSTSSSGISISAGNVSQTSGYAFSVFNSKNNVDIRASSESNGYAGLYHRGTIDGSSNGGSAKWLIYIDQSGTVTSNATSDIRYKSNIKRMGYSETLSLLRGVNVYDFTLKEDKESIVQNGMMAQEIRDILIKNNLGYRPYLTIQSNTSDELYTDINTPEEKVVYGLDYSKFTPILWSGWQYHDELITQLNNEIRQLKKEIIELKNKLK